MLRLYDGRAEDLSCPRAKAYSGKLLPLYHSAPAHEIEAKEAYEQQPLAQLILDLVAGQGVDRVQHERLEHQQPHPSTRDSLSAPGLRWPCSSARRNSSDRTSASISGSVVASRVAQRFQRSKNPICAIASCAVPVYRFIDVAASRTR